MIDAVRLAFTRALAGGISLRREEGQTLTEYALVLGIVTVAVVGVLGLLSGDVKSALQNTVDSF